VHGDELLLLAERAEEAERVAAEADQRDGAEHRERKRRRDRDTSALARPAWREHEERQQQPGGHLDADPRRQRGRAGAQLRP
jgi:hypothetical protein